MDNYALYSQVVDTLPEEHIRELGSPKRFSTETSDDGKSWIYEWDDLKITINEMPAGEIEEHLNGFMGYVRYLSKQKGTPVDQQLVERIAATTMVLGIIVEPEVDDDGRADEVIGTIAYNTESLMFVADSVYDENAELLIGP